MMILTIWITLFPLPSHPPSHAPLRRTMMEQAPSSASSRDILALDGQNEKDLNQDLTKEVLAACDGPAARRANASSETYRFEQFPNPGFGLHVRILGW